MRQGPILEGYARPLRAARLAVLAIFFLNGFGFASFVVRIPAVQEKLSLGEGLLGLAYTLVMIAAGCVPSIAQMGELWLAHLWY